MLVAAAHTPMNGTLTLLARGTIASETGLSMPPKRTAQPSLSMSSRAAVWPLAGFDSSSRRISSTMRPPSTPPRELISSMATARPRVMPSPDLAEAPDKAATRPIFTGSAADAKRAPRLVAARPASGSDSTLRRERFVDIGDLQNWSGGSKSRTYRLGKSRARSWRQLFRLKIGLSGGLELQTERQGGIAAANGRQGSVIQLQACNVADGIVLAHIEGVVGAHDDPVGTEDVDEVGKLVFGEHDRIKIDLPEICRRRQREIAVSVRARPPGVIDPAGIGGEITTAVNCEQFQVRKSRQRAVEDQVVERERRLQRIAEDVIQIKMRQPV